jgi:chromate reductase, NAD(P)H dehydrogenase (quinone)
MKKIIAFAGSSSKNSINKQLVTYVVSLFEDIESEILDLNDYEMPIYSADREIETGIPHLAIDFFKKLGNADLIVVSLAEHNGAYSTAFKNIFDWTSRHNNKLFQQKPLLLMATSPGPRGGSSVLEIAKDRFPRHDANLVATFSLPSFRDNFDEEIGITNEALKNELQSTVKSIVF